MKVNKFQRGQIWWFENSYSFDGSVQGGTRPAIIVSNNKANEYSKNLVVVPCTTSVKRLDMKTHIKFDMNGVTNIALCENIMSANIQKLTNYIGFCDDDLLNKIECGVKIALGLSDDKSNNNIVVETSHIEPIKLEYEEFIEQTAELDNNEVQKPKVRKKT